jgi:hypothetical protein
MGRVPTDPAVTYRVYSADDIPVRMPRRMPTMPPSPWPPVRRAALEFWQATKTWALAPKPRPPLQDALRAPSEAVVSAVRPALASVDWKKWSLGIAIGVGTAITILLAVLAVAELADGSAKPRSARAVVIEPAAAPVRADVADDSDPATTPVVEAEPVPAVAAKPSPRASMKGKKPVEVFIP